MVNDQMLAMTGQQLLPFLFIAWARRRERERGRKYKWPLGSVTINPQASSETEMKLPISSGSDRGLYDRYIHTRSHICWNLWIKRVSECLVRNCWLMPSYISLKPCPTTMDPIRMDIDFIRIHSDQIRQKIFPRHPNYLSNSLGILLTNK